MKVCNNDEIFGGRMERIWIDYRQNADFFVRRFEIRTKILLGIDLRFSNRCIKTSIHNPKHFLNFLKNLVHKIEERSYKKYENEI
jgi:hypothetical protein